MDYKKELGQKQMRKLYELRGELPVFCGSFFDYYSGTLNRAPSTLLGYARDIQSFFAWMVKTNPTVSEIKAITLADLDKLTPYDIQDYMSYLQYHVETQDGIETVSQCDAPTRARHLAALRSFFHYYFSFGSELHSNPAKVIGSPKLTKKDQPRLDTAEFRELVDDATDTSKLSETARPYHVRTSLRDTAIIALLGGTGIRVSELVGIDLSDIDWTHNGIRVNRKGGSTQTVYFGSELARILKDYIEYERKSLDELQQEPALFLSSRGTAIHRLSTRSVERLVKQYGTATIPTKRLTPHALRRTFGTAYYKETSDIYAVADALGHKNIQVTKDHYANISDSKRQEVKQFSDSLLSDQPEDRKNE